MFNGSGVAVQIELRKIVVDHMLSELDRILDIRAIAVGAIPFDNIFVWQDLLVGGFYGQSRIYRYPHPDVIGLPVGWSIVSPNFSLNAIYRFVAKMFTVLDVIRGRILARLDVPRLRAAMPPLLGVHE